MRTDKRSSQKPDKKMPSRVHKRGIVGYSKKSALLEEAITHMNTGKYGRSSAALKELLALDPQNLEARRLFATLHLRLGSLVTARQAFESLANEAIGRQDYWLAESLLREYLAAGPRCVPFLEQLAQVYQEKGDEMAAVEELGKAIEILRDDPDVDNPQKAAQLYSKIRELAPASSVAFQLASLFDVQTGELLVRPSTSSIKSPDDAVPPNDFAMPTEDGPLQAVEHPLPEVMPWEVSDETTVEHETGPDVAEIQDPPAAEEVSLPEAAHEEVPFSFQVSELAPSEPSPDGLVQEVAGEEPPSDASPGISSPMPWEQMADASVQILEPEIPPAPDSYSTLESVLASLRTEDKDAAPPAVEEAPAPESMVVSAPETEPASSQPCETESAPLPAPMPWELISDPAIQIPIAETPTPVTEEPLPIVPVLTGEPSASIPVADVEPMPQATVEENAPLSPESTPSLEIAGPTPPEAPSASFSWNSVFDKAWKFTASTMAPSPTVPLEKGLEASEGSEGSEGPEIQAVENSVVEPPAVAPPSAQEESVPPIVSESPVSLSVTDDQVAREVVSPVPADASQAPPETSAPVDASLVPAETSPRQDGASHWNTGEVAVQVHRPSKKKKRWERESEDAGQTEPSPSPVESLSESGADAKREWKSTSEGPASEVETAPSPPVDPRPDWMQATETITFGRAESSVPQARWSDADVAIPTSLEPATSAAVSAVDVLFSPSPTAEDAHSPGPRSWTKPRPRLMARLHRVRIGISSFVGSCFSTTRSLTFLALMIAMATVVVAAAAVGAVGVMWMIMEDPPSAVYQNLTISPPRVVTDAKKNGYLLLLGFDAPEGQNPVQAGYERKANPERDRAAAQVCIGDDIKTSAGTGRASDHMMKGWIRSGDLLSNLRGQGATLRSLTSRESTALARYQQWLTLPFDDWGFGQSLSPNCPQVLLAHRLFVVDGFNQDLSTGLDRLEADAQAWRIALAQSRTLPMKMLAVTAVQDDALIAAGLLSRADLDGAALGRLSKIVRPLDQVELSIRWPMQSQFVWATQAVSSELKEDGASDRPWHASVAAAMRLPVQRRANAYAEYYEAANKTVAGGRYTNLPKVSAFIQTQPNGLMDYLTNPVEQIVGIEPLPSWEPYVMRMVEADAQLRLVGLQAWLRRGPQDGDVLMRLAKAGQAYYDPFTGLPMLVNQRKGVIYSVGRDGKDQEGDDVRDVTVMIPLSDSRHSSVSFR